MEHYDCTPRAIKGMPAGCLHPSQAIIWAHFQDISQNGKRQNYEKQTKQFQSVSCQTNNYQAKKIEKHTVNLTKQLFTKQFIILNNHAFWKHLHFHLEDNISNQNFYYSLRETQKDEQ